jgi:serine/threonine protein kinase
MEIGTILNEHYQIRSQLSRKLGRTTCLADDLSTQEPVIIKLLRFNEEFQWDNLKLFEREAATLKNLDRPEIPKYLDYFELPDGFALVQAYIGVATEYVRNSARSPLKAHYLVGFLV